MDSKIPRAVLEMFRGACECGKWMMIPRSYTKYDPYKCECGRTYWHDPDHILHCDESTRYRHREAFRLMQYECESCKTMEWFWNSRDGVTPFVVTGSCKLCDGDMKHVRWGQDRYNPDHIPSRGDGVFIDMPQNLKRTVALARIKSAEGTKFEVPPEKRDEIINALVNGFQAGEPWFLRW